MSDRYSPDPFDNDRPLWVSRLYALTLAAAILGLAACLVRMGWLCWTV